MSSPTVEIKMCGLRSVADIDAACAAGADMLGMVFVPGARRSIALPTARAMVARAREHGDASLVAVVGGDVDPSDAIAIVHGLGVDAIQLVGSETAADAVARKLAPSTRVLRTLAVHDDDAEGALDRATAWEARGARVIFEPHVAGALGGTGTAFTREVGRQLLAPSNVRGIAGGLDPDNVARLVRDIAPQLVDVSSGIEADGHKDPRTMHRFAEAVRGAAS